MTTATASRTGMQQGFDRAAFEAFLAERNEPTWLVDARRAAWARFEALAWPARNEEEWMRTDIRRFQPTEFRLPGRPDATAAAPAPVLGRNVELGGSLASLDGLAAESRFEDSLRSRGVVFGSLESVARTDGELVRKHLGRAVTGEEDRFAALHAACWTGGLFVHVPRGVSVELPLHAMQAISDGGSDFHHTLVVLEEGAEATILEETAGGAASGLHCGAVELIVGPGARLRYVTLQNWGPGAWHFARQRALVERGASIQWTIGALGARLAKVNQHVALVGPDAMAQVNGVMFTEARQHLAYHTLQHHRAGRCRSDLLYKGALQDKSRIVWRGMIKVDPDAQKTDGYQRNDNLLLTEGARSDSIPGLEIEADDVRCTHGSTTGRVDDDQVFYARSRGLTKREAVRMIVTGFFQQVFDRITIESVRDALGEAIGRRVREYA